MQDPKEDPFATSLNRGSVHPGTNARQVIFENLCISSLTIPIPSVKLRSTSEHIGREKTTTRLGKPKASHVMIKKVFLCYNITLCVKGSPS